MKIVSRKSEWFIFAGFAMIIIASVGEAFLPKIDTNINTITDHRKYIELKQTWLCLLVGQIHSIGTVVLTTSLVMLGIRFLRQNLQKVKATLFIVAGLGICVFTLTVSYMAMKFDFPITKPNSELNKRNIETHNYDAKLKSKLSLMYASDKYKYEGKTVEYLSETGLRSLYQPTKEDIKFREQDELAREVWSATQRLARRTFFSWCGITAVSLLLGLFTPVRNERPTPA